ncbi:MAG: hypothetical protein AAFU55_16640, partial [Pseudomonadota bacterium]
EAALLATGFDRDYYLARYPDVADGGEEPIEHFMRIGDRQARNPTRWFSTADYRASLAERRAPQSVLKTAFGRYLLHDGKVSPAVKANGSAHPDFAAVFSSRGVDPETAAARLSDIEIDVAQRIASGPLGEMIAAARALEPQIDAGDAAAAPFNIALTGGRSIDMTATLLRLSNDLGGAGAACVILAGEGEAAAAHGLAQGAAETFGPAQVAVLFADGPRPADFAASGGARSADISAARARLPNSASRDQYLFLTLRALGAEVVVNAGSRACWAMARRHGVALRETGRFFGYFGDGASGAQADFPDAPELCDALAFRDDALKRVFVDRYALPPEIADRLRAGAATGKSPM